MFITISMEELFYELNPWWEKREFKFNSIVRAKYLDKLLPMINNKDIIILTGLRRVGKTTILKQIISNLIQMDVEVKNIFYISLDMLTIKDLTIREIIIEFRKIHKISNDEKVYVFLDEVTSKKDYNQELKNLYDIGNIKIFVSSSSASLLKDGRAYLTGRARYFEIETLDFNEFLKFSNYEIKKSERHLTEKYFEEYMEFGGIPEYILTKDPTYLSELINTIIYKDIIAKNNIKNSEFVFDLFRLLCERVGKLISYNKLSKILGISKDSVQTYINYFIDTYLFYQVEVDGKLNEKILKNKKLYCSDVGIRNLISGFKDKGAIYENLVYTKIRQNSPNYYLKKGIEIDFITKESLIEAKFGQELSDDQKKLFDKVKRKNKIVANGVDFFLD